MDLFSFRTDSSTDPTTTFTPHFGYEIRIVSPTKFDQLPGHFEQCHSDHYFKIRRGTVKGQVIIYITNSRELNLTHIDRDDVLECRRSLAGALPPLLPSHLDQRVVAHKLPLSLMTPLYSVALSVRPSAENILRTFSTNSQSRFDLTVQEYSEHPLSYDVKAYNDEGVACRGYSHIRHFAYLYRQTMLAIASLLATSSTERITVIDLGTGAGHFLLAFAKWLRQRGLLDRFRLIGIDRTEHDMRFGREMAKEFPDADIQFLKYDITAPLFPDLLRRLKPDVLVAHHVVEHLEVKYLENEVLHDWLLAARLVIITVPLHDDPASSVSDHRFTFSPESLEKLARAMALRVGYAVEAEGIEVTSQAGMCIWRRDKAVELYGGFAREVVELIPRDIPTPAYSELYEDFEVSFDPARFRKKLSALLVGRIQDRKTFGHDDNRRPFPRQVRQLPIKMPGTSVFLPEELKDIQEFVQSAIDHNRAINNDYDKSYVYVNLFRGMTQFSSYRGLSLSCHGDQLQGLRAEYAFKPDYSYIGSSCLPTTFFQQEFDLSEAVRLFEEGERVDLYEFMNKQAQSDNRYYSENFAVYLLSPYIVHSASIAHEDMFRVFVKVAVSTKRFFDNRELRRNPAFDIEEWYHQETVGLRGDWLSHGHYNERFLKNDICPSWRA